MPGVTNFPVAIKTCANQKDGFHLTLTPNAGVDLTGAVLTCQIRFSAAAQTPIFSPSLAYSVIAGNLECDVTWTQEQSALLIVPVVAIEIDLALADDPTHPVMRFSGSLEVAPGGNLGS